MCEFQMVPSFIFFFSLCVITDSFFFMPQQTTLKYVLLLYQLSIVNVMSITSQK